MHSEGAWLRPPGDIQGLATELVPVSFIRLPKFVNLFVYTLGCRLHMPVILRLEIQRMPLLYPRGEQDLALQNYSAAQDTSARRLATCEQLM